MLFDKPWLGISVLAAAAICAAPNLAKAGPGGDSPLEIAADAYVYGYPLVLMDVTKQVMTAASGGQGMRAPINQFAHKRSFPGAAFTDVVSPNADTLYSSAWLDVSREPVVLSVPEMGSRYYLLQMMGLSTDVFASVGTRTTGNAAGTFAVVGPGWQGDLPAGIKALHTPTNLVWLLGRIQTNGPSDYSAVHVLQDGLKLTPLSAWGTDYVPPSDVAVDPTVDLATPPVDQVAKMDATVFFKRLAALLKSNPPPSADASMLRRLAVIGIEPQQNLNVGRLPAAVQMALDQGSKRGHARISAAAKSGAQAVTQNGWLIDNDTGRYGTDYLRRATVALVGLGANLTADAVYPHATVDSEGQPLSGEHRYVIHFAADQIPPVNAFWSVTLYNEHQFFAANALNRYAIGDRDALRFNADGSLDIYIQHDSPGTDKEANWLPAPAGSFNLLMRLYWPKPAVLDRTWAPAPVERVHG